jgi:predicted DNA-binding protein (MmcQ/YjbR family)
MNFELFRKFCLSFPDATEDVQWENNLLFRVRRKIFAGYNLEPPHGITLKCAPERVAELLEIEGVERAAYVGRYGWLAIASFSVLPDQELRELIENSYRLVAAKARAKPNSRPTRTVSGRAAHN